MSVCVLVDDSGFVHLSNQSVNECISYILVTPSELDSATALVTPTAANVSSAFAWGFGSIVVIGYFGSFAISVAKELIGKL